MLRESELELGLVDLPAGAGDAVYASTGDVAAILIHRDLPPAVRRSVLAHELVHHERGGTANLLDVGKEERSVDRITARRLLPDQYLERVVAELLREHDGVTAAMVAERTEVTVEYCDLRLGELLEAARARHPSGRGR